MADEKLTPKQRRFCEEFLKAGNATEAAKKAGYKESSAGEIGNQNLKKLQISSYIKRRMEEQDAALVAGANEVLQFYSAVMRGEVKDQFGMEASLSDRLKAADSLMKRYAAASDRNRTTMEKLDSMLKEFQDAVKSETN